MEKEALLEQKEKPALPPREHYILGEPKYEDTEFKKKLLVCFIFEAGFPFYIRYTAVKKKPRKPHASYKVYNKKTKNEIGYISISHGNLSLLGGNAGLTFYVNITKIAKCLANMRMPVTFYARITNIEEAYMMFALEYGRKYISARERVYRQAEKTGSMPEEKPKLAEVDVVSTIFDNCINKARQYSKYYLYDDLIYFINTDLPDIALVDGELAQGLLIRPGKQCPLRHLTLVNTSNMSLFHFIDLS